MEPYGNLRSPQQRLPLLSKMAQFSHPGGRILLGNRKRHFHCHRVGHSCRLYAAESVLEPANIGVPEDETGRHQRHSVGFGQRR
jgi:hypothetical protein